MHFCVGQIILPEKWTSSQGQITEDESDSEQINRARWENMMQPESTRHLCHWWRKKKKRFGNTAKPAFGVPNEDRLEEGGIEQLRVGGNWTFHHETAGKIWPAQQTQTSLSWEMCSAHKSAHILHAPSPRTGAWNVSCCERCADGSDSNPFSRRAGKAAFSSVQFRLVYSAIIVPIQMDIKQKIQLQQNSFDWKGVGWSLSLYDRPFLRFM